MYSHCKFEIYPDSEKPILLKGPSRRTPIFKPPVLYYCRQRGVKNIAGKNGRKICQSVSAWNGEKDASWLRLETGWLKQATATGPAFADDGWDS